MKTFFFLLIAGLSFPAFAKEASIAGMYDDVPLAYDKTTSVVSGYFNESTGAGQFSCIFYSQENLLTTPLPS